MPVSAKEVEPVFCQFIVRFVRKYHSHCISGNKAQQQRQNRINLFALSNSTFVKCHAAQHNLMLQFLLLKAISTDDLFAAACNNGMQSFSSSYRVRRSSCAFCKKC